MSSRRRFLSLLPFGLASMETASLDGGVSRRRRNCCATHRVESVTEPVLSPKATAEFVQPDYAKWRQIKEGMSRDELVALLGDALYRQDTDPQFTPPDSSHPNYEGYGYLWEYGYLRFADPSMPLKSINFTVFLKYATQKVYDKADPFHGRLSEDGRPTVPGLVVPHDQTVWNHYPRYLDLRWEPSSGMYPIRYEIEWASAQYEVIDKKASLGYPYPQTRSTDVPYFPLSFPGAQKGRWRVRAENKLGRSEWSKYRYFEFKK